LKLKIHVMTILLMTSPTLVDGSKALVSAYVLHLQDRILLDKRVSSGLRHDMVSQIAANNVRQEYMASKYRVSLYINVVRFSRIGQCGLEMSTNGSQQTYVNILRGRDVDIPFVDKYKRAVADWQL